MTRYQAFKACPPEVRTAKLWAFIETLSEPIEPIDAATLISFPATTTKE